MSEENPKMRKALVPIAAVAASVTIGVGAGSADAFSDVPDPPASKPAEGDIDVQVPDSKQRIEEYWTRDRMRAAKPMPTPRITRPAAEPAADGEDAEPE
jgi:hypothetical protein